jgi:hypothetical protein
MAKKKAKDEKELTKQVTTRFMLAMGEIIMLHKRTGGPARNMTAFAASIKAVPANISQYDDASNGRNVTVENCCELCRVYGINANWLLLGIGEKYTENNLRFEKIESRLQAVELAISKFKRP